MVKIPYGSRFIGLSDEHSDNDEKEISEKGFSNLLWKSFHGAHLYDVMNCVGFHSKKSYILEHYPLKKYFQAFISQIDKPHMKLQKTKVLLLRSYEVERQGTFALDESILDNLKRLKRNKWTNEDNQYFEEAVEYMSKYKISERQFFEELNEIQSKLTD